MDLIPQGQVPQPEAVQSEPYGIVGDGRVAQHFVHYFKLENIPFKHYARKTGQSPAHLTECPVWLLAVPDRAVHACITEFQAAQRTLVHFSGANPAPNGFHPLMTFRPASHGFYDLGTYRSIAFTGTAPESEFRALFPKLKNPYHRIPEGDRALYHALCVLGGNFSTLLWLKVIKEMQTRWKIPPQAVAAYARRGLENLLEAAAEGEPQTALTGPLTRGDPDTLSRNLSALHQSNDPYAGVYEAMIMAWEKSREKPHEC